MLHIINSIIIMQQSVVQQPCPNCRRSIESSRLPLHIHMCSTIKLRQSRIFTHSQPELETIRGTCIFCEKQLELSKMEDHMSQCSYRQVECDGCGNMYPFTNMWQHQGQCPGKLGTKKDPKQQKVEMQKEKEVPGNQSSNSNGEQRPSSEIYVQNIKKGLNLLGSKLLSEGSRLANYCNAFIEQNKGPALLTLEKLKQSLFYKIQDVFTAIASDPNTDGLPRRMIKEIQLAEYRANKNGQEEQLCTICCCEFVDQEPIKVLNCRHFYHPTCIDKWMKINKLCPLCKSDQSKARK